MTTETEYATAPPTAVVVSPSSTPTNDDVKNNRKCRMVALDLDGTLLNSKHEMSEATKTYLKHLMEQPGFTVILATGRAIATVYDAIHALNLEPHQRLPVVCSNGAEGLMCSMKHGVAKIQREPLFYTPVPMKVVQATLQLAAKLGFVVQCYVGDTIYANPSAPHHYALTGLYKELTGSDTVHVSDFTDGLNQGPPSKLLVLCRPEEQEEMLQAFAQELSQPQCLIDDAKNAATMVRGNLGWFMEMLHPHVHKGHGLQQMCHRLQIPIAECIAFGDGDNDMEFLQMAGKSFAMANARNVIKELPQVQVLAHNNDQDGVVRTLQQMEDNECLVLQ